MADGKNMMENSRRIKDWPQEERPREKLRACGPEALSDAQLLALILRTGDAPTRVPDQIEKSELCKIRLAGPERDQYRPNSSSSRAMAGGAPLAP